MIPRMREKAACALGLAVLLAAHLVFNLWWLRVDNHPVAADEALHMQFAELFYLALFAQEGVGFGARLSDAAAIETIYPPFLHVAGALLWVIWPYSAEALAFVSTLAFLALLGGVYALTQALFSPKRALLAAVLTGFTPFLFGASRLFIQDIPAAAFVVWTLYAAHQTRGFRHTGWVAGFALLAGLGLLARWTTPVYILIPGMMLLAMGAVPALRDAKQRGPAVRRMAANAALLAAVSLALAMPWYWARMDTLRTGYEEIFAGRQGYFHWFSLEDWSVYLIYIINTGTFLPLFLLACVGFAVMAWRREERIPGAVIFFWIAGAYVLLTITWPIKSPAPRYIIPFLPAFGIAAAAVLAAIPRGPWRKAAITVSLAILLLQYTNLTLAPVRPLHRVELPILSQHQATQMLGHSGLVVIRERVRASAARYYAPYRGTNWVEHTLNTMQEEDQYRHMAGSPRLHYGLIRLPKVGLERMQSYLNPHRGMPGWEEDHSHTIPESYKPIAGLPPDEAPSDDPFATWFRRPKPVSAYSVTYSDEEATAVRFVPQYWNGGSQQWASIGRPNAQSHREGLTIFQETGRVLTEGIRLQPTRASLEPRVEDITWYSSVYPHRPVALIAEGESLEDIADHIHGLEYLVVGGLRHSEMMALADEFLVIERFDAHLSGFWEPVEITILARYTILPR